MMYWQRAREVFTSNHLSCYSFSLKGEDSPAQLLLLRTRPGRCVGTADQCAVIPVAVGPRAVHTQLVRVWERCVRNTAFSWPATALQITLDQTYTHTYTNAYTHTHIYTYTCTYTNIHTHHFSSHALQECPFYLTANSYALPPGRIAAFEKQGEARGQAAGWYFGMVVVKPCGLVACL